MNWDFFIGYWIGCAVSAVIFAALRASDRKNDNDDDDYHYEPIDDDHNHFMTA
ncbi:MAG TPA: hypothetical protein VMT81_02640 [Candidatus Paceibacterota bacterium]|nr:hypothetical protein [Candidatus Paceibacterota bacterium]